MASSSFKSSDIHLPPLARLPTSLLHPDLGTGLARAALPSASLTQHVVKAELGPSRPSPALLETTSTLINALTSVPGVQRPRPRALSVGLVGRIQDVAEKHGVVARKAAAQDETNETTIARYWTASTSWWSFGNDNSLAASDDRSVKTAGGEGEESSFNFMSLFAGRGAIEEAKLSKAKEQKDDQVEAEMLDRSLDQLKLDRSSSRLDPPHLGRRPTLFTTSSRQHHGRRYSSGPGTSRKQVSGYLDEEDSKTAKVEEDANLDMFDLIRDRYRCPKLPIIFCHGLFGFDTLSIGPESIKSLQFSYWVGVKEALEAIGVRVLIARVPATASIEERAKVLCTLIEKEFPGQEVNLVGHSMGGLDCRYLISHLKPTSFKVRSLTTMATPHRGSPYADWLIDDILGAQRMPPLLSLLETLGLPGGGKAFEDLTVKRMQKFNEQTPDSADVKYFSYGASFIPTWSNAFRLSWGVINEKEGPNDGLVSVESSKWGTYKGTLENVTHLDLIGMLGKIRFGWAKFIGKEIRFKPVSFYCALSESLADEGF